MTQQFNDVPLNKTISDSLGLLLNRDTTSLTLSSGVDFPQNVNDSMIGMLCNRTDVKTLYTLIQANPPEWQVVLNYSSTIPSGGENDAKYQPLNRTLTALSKGNLGVDQIQYFINADEVQTLQLTDFSKDLIQAENAEYVRNELLGLGALATMDQIGNDEIIDNSIGLEKLNFSPVLEGEIFSTGDIKETYSDLSEEGWVLLESTIGNVSSGAEYENEDARELFLLMWSNPFSEILPQKGGSSVSDWDSLKVLKFPIYESLNNTKIWVKL